MSLTRFAFTNYRFIWVLGTSAFLLGLLGYVRMPRQEDPSLSAFNGVITVVYPGATVDEIEDRIIDPLEERFQEIEEVDTIESTARPGFAFVNAEFREDSDKERAYDLLLQELASVQPDFPEGVVEVRTFSAKPSNVAVMELALHGKDAEPRDLLAWAEELESRLRTLSDIKSVELSGEREPQVQVTVDPDRLTASGLTLGQVYDALRAANGNVPGGVVHAGDRRLSVRSIPRFEAVPDIEETVLRTVDGRPVVVNDVATVSWGTADPVYLARYNGEPAVVITLTLKEGRNVFDLAKSAHRELEAFQGDLPPGLATTIVADQSADVQSRLRTFGFSLLQGGLIISLFVAVFAGRRPALAVVTALGLSVGISFIWLELFGIALQQMSIAGLVVVLGLLVDNAIVVVEAIQQERTAGHSPEEAAIRGTDRVSSAVASSTATTLAAFVPMLLMAGSVGEFTRDIPVVVCIVLIVSLAIALTVTPLLTARSMSKQGKERSLGQWFRRVIGNQLYLPLLRQAVRTPKKTLIVAFLLGTIPFLSAPFVGMNFFPVAEKPIFLVRVLAPEGTSIESTSERVARVERWLLQQPQVRGVVVNIGEHNPTVYYNQFRRAGASSLAEILVEVEREAIPSIPEFGRRLRQEFASSPDFVVETKPFVQGPPIGLPVSVRLTGNDLTRLSGHADDLARDLRAIPGAINVANGLRPGAARLDLEIDPVAVDRLGLNSLVVAREVRLALAGGTATQVRSGDEDRDVVVRIAPEGNERIADLERLHFPSKSGRSIPLAQLTRPRLTSTYAEINHTDLKRSVVVGADLDERLATEVMNDLWPSVEQLDLNAEESVSIIGEDEERDRAFLSMLTNLIVAAGLIYGVLVLQFRSFLHPLIIFSSVPIAFGGSFAALFLTGWPFGFTAFVGLLALTGIVVNNAIVLVDQINRLRQEGHHLEDALVQGAISRLQPIFLTTVTTIAGLLPLTLTGSSMWSPMGWVIIGGLLSSTLVTLALVPTLYFLIERRSGVQARRKERGGPTPDTSNATAKVGVGLAGLALFFSIGVAAADPPTLLDPTRDSWTPTLAELLQDLEVSNPDLAVERYGTEVARADLRSAKALRWPTVRAEAGWEMTDDPSAQFGLALASGSNPLQGGLDGSVQAYRATVSARWVLFDPTRGPRIDAAGSVLDLSDASAEASRQRLELAATEFYFNFVSAREDLEILESSRDLIRAERENAEARFATGRTVESDVLGLEARESEIEAARIAAIGRLDLLGAELARLLGSTTTARILPRVEERIPRLSLADLSDAQDLAQAERSELRAARAALEAEDKRRAATSRQRLPILVGSAEYSGVAPERRFEDESRNYSARLGLEWIPFRGGAIGAETERSRAQVHQREETLRSLELQADRDVIRAWTRREIADRQIEAAEAGRAAADEAYRIVELRFREGRDTLARYLGAELARTESKTRLVEARVARELAEAEMKWATGTPLLAD